MKSPEEWVQEIHKNAVSHGWWDEDRNFGEICALIHSELSEALEEYRNGNPLVYYRCPHDKSICDPQKCADINRDPVYVEEPCDGRKPEGIAVELADVVIRIFDYFGKVQIFPRGNVLKPNAFITDLTKQRGEAFNAILKSREYAAMSNAIERDGTFRSFGDLIARCHADVSAAYEADAECDAEIFLLECVGQIALWLEFKKLDLEALIAEKHEYNKSRPYRHGGKVL